jgi:uncharacterized protein YbaP (TraB family)
MHMDELDAVLTATREAQKAENDLETAKNEASWNMAAMIASTVANCHRDPKRRPYKLEEFLPDFDGEKPKKKQQTWQEQLAVVEALNAAFGGKDLRGG